MKGVDKILLTVRRVETMYIEVSEHNGFDMPESIMEAHEMLMNIKNDPESYIQDVDKAEAHVELFIDKLEIVEENT